MDILSQIIEYKRDYLKNQKAKVCVATLEELIVLQKPKASFKKAIVKMPYSLIAEFKRKSPSKGIINITSSLQDTLIGYEKAGASAVSILTDDGFFGGSLQDLEIGSTVLNIPILRKEFIIDPYQILEARAFGASAILLIARILDPELFKDLANFAKILDLDVLVEIHNLNELKKIDLSFVDVLGVNNRNLSNFKTGIQVSIDIAQDLPKNILKISESGIYNAQDANTLLGLGYNGFLIGEQFMRTDNPAKQCENFINSLNNPI